MQIQFLDPSNQATLTTILYIMNIPSSYQEKNHWLFKKKRAHSIPKFPEDFFYSIVYYLQSYTIYTSKKGRNKNFSKVDILPESVNIGPFQAVKFCNFPCCSTNLDPG